MKRFLAIMALTAVFGFSLFVPVSASTVVSNRTAYEVNELVTESIKDFNAYRLKLGDTDERYSPAPFLVRYRYYAGQTTSHQYLESVGHFFPNSSTDAYSPSYTYSYNIYPFGATSSNGTLYYSTVKTDDLLVGSEFNWVFEYVLGFSSYTNELAWVPFDLKVELRFHDSNNVFMSSVTHTLVEDFTFGDIADTTQAPLYAGTSVIQETIPVNASYFAYRYVIEFAQPDSTFTGQMFASSFVYVTSRYGYEPPEWTITDIATTPPSVNIPDGSDSIEDILNKEENIFDTLYGDFVKFDGIFTNGISVLEDWAVVITVAFSIIEPYLAISAWHDLVLISIMVGLVSVILNISLTVFNRIRYSSDAKGENN